MSQEHKNDIAGLRKALGKDQKPKIARTSKTVNKTNVNGDLNEFLDNIKEADFN